MKKLFVAGIGLLALLCVGAQSNGPRTGAASQSVSLAGNAHPRSDVRRETFEIVWRTVKEKHFDPTFGGVDWDKVREEYSPQVELVKNDQELYKLLQRMLGELHQSHFNIIPPEAIVPKDSEGVQTGGIGIDVRIINDQAVITRVQAGSPAERAGLHAGFAITVAGDSETGELFSRFANSAESAAVKRLRMARAVIAKLDGSPGTAVQVSYEDGRNQKKTLTVVREARQGILSPAFGNFPAQYAEFEARRLTKGIGYIRFSMFVIPLMEKIRAAIRSMADAPGIIFDLRGNPGGFGGMSGGIAGLLETREISLGTMRLRSGYQNFAVFPQANPYRGPVVILIDGGSASTSEVFAAGMQEIGRAVIVGERSAGAALPSVFGKLPTGALFQYAIADFRTPKGVVVEGRGVIPDIEVKLERTSLLAGEDQQLIAAILEIEKRNERAKKKEARSAASGR